MNRHERRAAKAQGIDIGIPEVRYGGRTLEVKVIINTDEPIEEVVGRIIPVAKGPNKRMVIVAGGVVETEHAKAIWDEFIPNAIEQARKGGMA